MHLLDALNTQMQLNTQTVAVQNTWRTCYKNDLSPSAERGEHAQAESLLPTFKLTENQNVALKKF